MCCVCAAWASTRLPRCAPSRDRARDRASKIFYCGSDRYAFLDRLDGLVLETEAGLYAWALMPNHAHALLRTGKLPLSWLCQRWLGPYATTFNLLHRRAGHLAGGWEFVPKLGGGRERWAFDERILGGSEFVEQALQRVQEQWPLRSNDVAEMLDGLCGRVAKRTNLTLPEIRGASLRQCVLDARAIISHLAVRHYGLSMTATARFLCISRQSDTRALDRAQGACDRQGCHATDFLED